MRKIKMPKCISENGAGGYKVRFYQRDERKSITIGTYPTIKEAIIARDEYINSGNNVVYIPRGIVYNKAYKKYDAYLNYGEGKFKINFYIGRFDTQSEAVNYRNNFILGLI